MGKHFPEFYYSFIQGLDVSVVGYFLSHISPGSLDRVELRRIRRQVNQFQNGFCQKPFLQKFCMMIPHIVQHQDDFWMLSVDVQNFLQMLFETFVVSFFMEWDRYLASLKVIAAHCGLSLPPSLFGHDLRLAAYLAPFIANGGGIWQGKLILKQQNRINGTLQKFFLNCLWIPPGLFCPLRDKTPAHNFGKENIGNIWNYYGDNPGAVAF